MKNRSPSFPKKVAEKNSERWVVYYFDTEKQKRWARRFSTEAEALEFFREKNVYDEKLGVEANRISPTDRRELVEAKMLLAPLRTSLTNAVLTYVKLTKDLEPHGISLNRAIEEYKALSKLKERSVRLDFAIDRYCLSLQKKELSGKYLTGVERILFRFMESFERDRIVSLIGGKEIFHWLINLKKREYADSDKLHVDYAISRVKRWRTARSTTTRPARPARCTTWKRARGTTPMSCSSPARSLSCRSKIRTPKPTAS